MEPIINYFDEMASIWDDATLHNKTYIRNMLKLTDIKEGDKILDIGSGTGVLIDYIREVDKCGNIVEVDSSQKMLNMARAKNYNDENVIYLRMDVENTEIEGVFDIIILYNSLPYLRNKVEVLTRLYDNNLNNDGRVLIFHNGNETQINLLHACGDKRISNAYLPPFDYLSDQIQKRGISIVYSSNDDYAIVLKK